MLPVLACSRGQGLESGPEWFGVRPTGKRAEGFAPARATVGMPGPGRTGSHGDTRVLVEVPAAVCLHVASYVLL